MKQTTIICLLYHKFTICSIVKSIFNKKDTLVLPAKEQNDCQQNDYKRKQFHIVFFCAGNKGLKLLTHYARPFRHCRSIFHPNNAITLYEL